MNINYAIYRNEQIIAYFQNYDDAMDFIRADLTLGNVRLQKVVYEPIQSRIKSKTLCILINGIEEYPLITEVEELISKEPKGHDEIYVYLRSTRQRKKLIFTPEINGNLIKTLKTIFGEDNIKIIENNEYTTY